MVQCQIYEQQAYLHASSYKKPSFFSLICTGTVIVIDTRTCRLINFSIFFFHFNQYKLCYMHNGFFLKNTCNLEVTVKNM